MRDQLRSGFGEPSLAVPLADSPIAIDARRQQTRPEWLPLLNRSAVDLGQFDAGGSHGRASPLSSSADSARWAVVRKSTAPGSLTVPLRTMIMDLKASANSALGSPSHDATAATQVSG